MKKLLYAVLSGLVLAMSWPTYGFPFFLFTAFVPLLLLEHEITIKKEKRSGWRVFVYSYLAFCIWNIAATQWLRFAQNPDGSNSWIAFLFPVLVNSLLMAVVFVLFHCIKKITGTRYGMAFFPAVWICFETFHLRWEMSWPWLNLGNAFADYVQTVQWYEFTGTFGGTLWVLLVNLMIFYFVRAFQVTLNKIYLWKVFLYSVLAIGVPVAISLLMFVNYKEKSEQELEVVLIQPKLDPYQEKYNKSSEIIVDELLKTADTKVSDNTAFIVAPETAFPGKGYVMINNIQQDFLINKIRGWIKIKTQKPLFVSGISLAELYDYKKTPTARFLENNKWVDLYNSSIQIGETQEIEHYNKTKLVVGVEHFPYASVLQPLIGEYMLDFGGTMEGLGVQGYPVVFGNNENKAKVAPIICYESIYGEYVGEYVKKGANVLFIMTNDSWWSNSQGHKQLLAYARLRAVETRRDIARSANSGISAFINQKGEIVNSLPYDTQGALNGKIKLNTQLTFYVRYGDLISRLALIFTGIIIAYAISKKVIPLVKRK